MPNPSLICDFNYIFSLSTAYEIYSFSTTKLESSGQIDQYSYQDGGMFYQL